MRLMVAPDAAVPVPPVSVPVPVPAGLVLTPFRAARFAATGADLAALTSPPYDVIDEDERTALEASAAHNVVRLILPRDVPGDVPGAGAPGGADEVGNRYEQAARTLRAWLDSGVLVRDDVPTLYVYEQRQGEHVQRGLVGALALADPDAQIVLPHENTMAGPVSDRLSLTRATAANLEPIFLLYDGGGPASAAVAEAVASPPIIDVDTDVDTADRVTHRLWAIDDPATLEVIAADLLPRRAVIADGHHRYATYRQYQAERHAAGDGDGPWDFGLTFLVDATASGPQVHAIHRAVRGLILADAVSRARESFTVRQLTTANADDTAATAVGTGTGTGAITTGATAATAGPATAPVPVPVDPATLLDELATAGRAGHAFVITDGSAAYLLTQPSADLLRQALPAERSEAFRRLDVTVAHLALISQVWKLEDAVGVVDYYHDAPAALAAARASGGVALLLNPTPVADVIAVAGAAERMPRKSTLFTPKPRTGLLMRPLD
ncbi:Uncharacterized conserved protein, DUF1015 family [Parafrankia irregularis]|uniref:Uncharacterized conserved protein, DUF1015 family n=1 Tax=Parafrankia irregularis TaxID=795642 RepID=A0A0S4R079_9ACTN|nr:MULTISPECIES: DUF1015 domain-containing protein [Parafrankia]MBE3206302.1 DUF1015 domain-containing protein [Parafrankia sp. CH37]CUU60138.1 Uncharacterized conserved protein, DUF1015 family [Parafrankia irregularis]